MKTVLSALLLSMIFIAFLSAITVILWGSIDFSIPGVHFSLSHPDRAVLLLCIGIMGYLALVRKISIRNQFRLADEFLFRHDRRIPWILFLSAFLFLLRIKWMQHFTFKTGYDFAMYDTAIRNTLRGRLMFCEYLGASFFSDHFVPVLLLICPLYLIADSPLILLFLQAAAVSGSLAVMYKICRHHDLQPLVSTIVPVIFLNYKPLAEGTLFQFHPEMFEPLLILGCIYCVLKSRFACYFVFLILALGCKEDVAISTFCLGLYLLFNRRTRRIGMATSIISAVWAFLSWTWIIPSLLPEPAQVSRFLTDRWSHLGQDYISVISSLLLSPGYVLSCCFSKPVLEMLLRLGFIPLIGFEPLLIALPALVMNTTADYPAQASLRGYYSAPLIPFIFWAFIRGLVRIRSHFFRKRPRAMESIKLTALVSLFLYAAATFGTHYQFYPITPAVSARYRVMHHLPDSCTVSCEAGFLPHLLRNHNAWVFPSDPITGVHYSDCDFILVDRNGKSWPLEQVENLSLIDALLRNPDQYELVCSEMEVYLLKVIRQDKPFESPVLPCFIQDSDLQVQDHPAQLPSPSTTRNIACASPAVTSPFPLQSDEQASAIEGE